MNGILPLWKPRGITSHDCVYKVRKLFNTQKVGHTGTLDPEVEGVLGICIGHATKMVPYLTAMKKTYIAECSLGKATETEDAHGEVVDEKEVITPPTHDEIEEVLDLFRGEIEQIPPMYSAVKVNGKKLYQYARANEYVERPVRKVTIHKLSNISEDKTIPTKKFKLRVACSEGTYIRTLCVDIGNKLGYPAHMSELVRVEASSFVADNTITFQDIEIAKKDNKLNDLLIPIEEVLTDMDHLYVNKEDKKKVSHGYVFPLPKDEMRSDPFLVFSDDELIALYQINPNNRNEIKPIRVFLKEM